MRQILYVSYSTVPGDGADLVDILDRSRHNNALDGVTGLLWSDGTYFLQVIEGPFRSVSSLWGRLLIDARHRDVRVICDQTIQARAFGDWTMIHRRSHEPVDIYDYRVRQLISAAPGDIQEAFIDMITPVGSATSLNAAGPMHGVPQPAPERLQYPDPT